MTREIDMQTNVKKQWVLWNFILVLPLLVIQQAHAKIYKCENSDSEVFYIDKPCPVDDKETKIRAEKDVENGYKPPAMIKKTRKVKKEILNIKNSVVKSTVAREKKVSKGSNSQEAQQRTKTNTGKIVSKLSFEGSAPPMLPRKDDNDDASSQDVDTGEGLPALSQEEKRQQLNISIIPDT